MLQNVSSPTFDASTKFNIYFDSAAREEYTDVHLYAFDETTGRMGSLNAHSALLDAITEGAFIPKYRKIEDGGHAHVVLAGERLDLVSKLIALVYGEAVIAKDCNEIEEVLGLAKRIGISTDKLTGSSSVRKTSKSAINNNKKSILPAKTVETKQPTPSQRPKGLNKKPLQPQKKALAAEQGLVGKEGIDSGPLLEAAQKQPFRQADISTRLDPLLNQQPPTMLEPSQIKQEIVDGLQQQQNFPSSTTTDSASNLPKRLKCPVRPCRKISNTFVAWQSHVANGHFKEELKEKLGIQKSDETTSKCKMCSKQFTYQKKCLSHFAFEHKALKGKIDDKSFQELVKKKQIPEPTTTAENTANDPPGVFRCYQKGCEKTFVSKMSLQTHMAGIHFKEILGDKYKLTAKTKKCNECEKSFSQEQALLRHLAFNHNGLARKMPKKAFLKLTSGKQGPQSPPVPTTTNPTNSPQITPIMTQLPVQQIQQQNPQQKANVVVKPNKTIPTSNNNADPKSLKLLPCKIGNCTYKTAEKPHFKIHVANHFRAEISKEFKLEKSSRQCKLCPDKKYAVGQQLFNHVAFKHFDLNSKLPFAMRSVFQDGRTAQTAPTNQTTLNSPGSSIVLKATQTLLKRRLSEMANPNQRKSMEITPQRKMSEINNIPRGLALTEVKKEPIVKLERNDFNGFQFPKLKQTNNNNARIKGSTPPPGNRMKLNSASMKVKTIGKLK